MNPAAVNRAMAYGLQAFLAAGLATKLAAVDAEVGSSTTPAPADTPTVGYRDYQTARAYPFACIVAGPGSVEEVGQRSILLKPSFDLGFALVHAKPDVLEDQLLRYLDAVIALFSDDPSAGGTCELASIVGWEIGHGALGDKQSGVLVVTVDLQKETVSP